LIFLLIRVTDNLSVQAARFRSNIQLGLSPSLEILALPCIWGGWGSTGKKPRIEVKSRKPPA
jgi:hypothetical protein